MAGDLVEHHLTGSITTGYLDPDLLVSLRLTVHDEVHALLRAAGLEYPAALLRDDPVGRTELRLRRLAVACAVVAASLSNCEDNACPLRRFILTISDGAQQWADELSVGLDE
jgi:hypothetical protein